MPKSCNENLILFEEGGISVTKDCKFWIYVLSENQWNIISENFNNNNTYISAYSKKGILENDIILFYIKIVKGAKSKRSTKDIKGFVAIGQASEGMIRNNDNIEVYDDKNLNRFVVELNTISICDEPIELSKFNTTIQNTNGTIKSSRHFGLTMLKGECTFAEIMHKKLGLALMQEIFTLTNTAIDKLTDNDDIDDNVSDDIDDNVSDDIDDNVSDDIEDNVSDDSEIEIEDIDSLNDNSGKMERDLVDNDYITVNNIPILLLPCDGLTNCMKKLKKDNNKIDTVIKHYKYCEECDITNNNGRELQPTLNYIKLNDIIFQENEHELCLDAYLMAENYPEDFEDCGHYIKIYYLTDGDDYDNSLLIEFTSQIIPINNIVDVDTNVSVKSRKKNVDKKNVDKKINNMYYF